MSNINQKSLKYHKAFKEVYILINDFSSELYIKIPKSFIKILKENMDKTYDVSLEKLHSEGTMEETDAVMSLVFRDFICPDELSKRLIEYDKKQIEEEIDRYNNIVGNNGKVEEYIEDKDKTKTADENECESFNEEKENTVNNQLVVIKEETIFRRIINLIKSLFKRNNEIN